VRPPVTVICPFAGGDDELDRAVAALAAVRVREGDEVLLADNRTPPRPGLHRGAAAGRVEVISAPGPASSYFARAVAARRARGEWLVFVDADTEPDPGLLDAYFAPPPGERTAVLAGGIEDWAAEATTTARYIAARRKLAQATTLARPGRPYAQTANCAVRRSAFEQAGGWPEPIRSGGDADLCWRLEDAGWALEERPAARVRHRNRATLRALLGQLQRHGAGMKWLDGRWPGAFPAPAPREYAGRFAMLARGIRHDDPRFAAVDFLALWARDLGRLRANR
jgi:GT2 family glycosyltransferase